MLTHNTQHVESVRHRSSHVWPNNPTDSDDFRPALHFTNLIKLLKQAARLSARREDAENSKFAAADQYEEFAIGQKRHASVLPETTSKKRKVVQDKHATKFESLNTRHSNSPAEGQCGRDDDSPDLDSSNALVSVFQHDLEIQYTKYLSSNDEQDFYVDNNNASQIGWLQEETELEDFLHQQSDETPHTYDLGTFLIRKYRGRLVALCGNLANRQEEDPVETEEINERWFFLIPRVSWPDGLDPYLDQYDYQPSLDHSDILTACVTLQSTGCFAINTRVRLVTLPTGASDFTKELPFRLHIEFTVSLVLHTLYRPLRSSSTRKLTELENVQRRFLSYITSSSSGYTLEFSPGKITIPFFYSILQMAPPIDSPMVMDALQPNDLLPMLLPFQRRSVAWMLEREGKIMTSEGELIPIPSAEAQSPLFWDRVEFGNHSMYINQLSAGVCAFLPERHNALGGILAEEPGLGKTLESIALVLLNPARDRVPSTKRWDAATQLDVGEIKTTLIVTPPSLAAQWADEIALHAPSLKVFIYDGWSKLTVPIAHDAESVSEVNIKRKNSRLKVKERCVYESEQTTADDAILDWCSYINTFDICITTYNVLRQDFNVARAPPKRPRRQDVEYSNLTRPRSPLVMCEWYRVIMDEVQMMGGGKLEEMVSLIPRLSSFAVSGTPARTQAGDLIQVLKFLRIHDIVSPPRIWGRLLKEGYKKQFAALFQRYAIRTVKSTIKNELTIPQQTRYLVSIELGRIEKHVYDQSLESALIDLGLDRRGVAASEGWEVDTALLRSFLRKLRGICTHPQVGQLQRQGDRMVPLKSMSEVLDVMRDQNWRNLMEDRKSKVQALTLYAQLQQHDEEHADRYHRALECLQTAEKEAEQIIEEIKTAITEHAAKSELLKNEAFALRDARRQRLLSQNDDPSGKGKEREQLRDLSPLTEDDDVGDDDLPRTPAGEEHGIKRRALQQRLRECCIALHKVKFLQGDVHHVLGEFHLAEESAAYAAAEVLRQNLLKATEESASKYMANLDANSTARGVNDRMLMVDTPYLGRGGIRSADLMEEANSIIEESLNAQTSLLWQWRSKICTLLTRGLSTGSDEADGEEYARTLETQGEAEIYLQVYATLLADRREVLVAERTILAAHDARQKRFRATNAAKAAGERSAELEISDDVELQPEHEALHAKLTEERKELFEKHSGRAIKSIMVDLSNVAARVLNEGDSEKIIARDGAATLRSLVNFQMSLLEKLDGDLAQLRRTFNERILYFRQLQEISDTVAEATWQHSVAEAMRECMVEQQDLEIKIHTNRARQRYLDHLAHNSEGGTSNTEETTCILCSCEFVRGFVTQCAHVFCEVMGCMKAWVFAQRGKACPVCRAFISVDQLQRFSLGGDKPPPSQPRIANGEPVPVSRREIEYNMIDPGLFSEIQNIESNGSYGSKIQTLIRHLLYLQLTDPGAKSIVFSAWADSLHIIEHALIVNKIPYLRIDRVAGKGKDSTAKRFRTDPNILVLLLHGERENAGLNVTCASRVFLLESVVHHGFEVQAIARVDRMGQTRPTEVYCYYAEDTVERNILDLAAKQGLSLYTKENSMGTLNITPLAAVSEKGQVDSPAKKGRTQKGDFISKTDDMLAILFPHMFEDIEYLVLQDQSGDNEPVAGPSRLTS